MTLAKTNNTRKDILKINFQSRADLVVYKIANSIINGELSESPSICSHIYPENSWQAYNNMIRKNIICLILINIWWLIIFNRKTMDVIIIFKFDGLR